MFQKDSAEVTHSMDRNLWDRTIQPWSIRKTESYAWKRNVSLS
ncbi:hypothetical protein [Leptospira santarosai]|nr:hypothetical protein [Leptospira santarosai]